MMTIDIIPETYAGGPGASNAESPNREPALAWDCSAEPVLGQADGTDTVRSVIGDDLEEAFLGDGNSLLNKTISE